MGRRIRKFFTTEERVPLSSLYIGMATLLIWLVLCGFFPLTNAVLTTSLLVIAVIDRISMLSQLTDYSLFSLSSAQQQSLLAIMVPAIIATTLSLLILYMMPVFISVLAVHFSSITSSVMALPALPYLASGLWLLQDHALRHIIPIQRVNYDKDLKRQSPSVSPFPQIVSRSDTSYSPFQSIGDSNNSMWAGK